MAYLTVGYKVHEIPLDVCAANFFFRFLRKKKSKNVKSQKVAIAEYEHRNVQNPL